jgi:hypothetical protein
VSSGSKEYESYADFMTRTGSRILVASLVGVQIVCAPSGGTAAPNTARGWSAPTPISQQVDEILVAQAALDSDGDAVALWLEGGAVGSALSLEVAMRRTGATGWSPPRAVWRDSKRVKIDAETVSLQVTGAGFAAVAFSAGGRKVRTRTYATTVDVSRATWSRPRVVRGGTAWGAAVSGPTEVTILIRDRKALFAIRGDLARQSWKTPELLPVAGPAPAGVDLAANERGDAIVAWTRCPAGSLYPCKLRRPSTFFTSTKRAGGRWSRPQTLDHADGGDDSL